MAITHSTTIRNLIADTVTAQLDVGSTNPNGQLIIQTGGAAEVATLNLNATAFGAAAAGVCTANAIADDTNATGGTAAQFELQDRDNNTVISGSVTGISGGGDIELSSTSIAATESVSISSMTYTAPV